MNTLRPSRNPRRAPGFTLIELMAVVAVVSLLALIAYPSYRDSIVKSRRRAATACLVELSHLMERHHTISLTYSGMDPKAECQGQQDAYYSFGFSEPATSKSYKLQAVPKGSQAISDTLCGSLGIDQSGVRTIEGSAASLDQCW